MADPEQGIAASVLAKTIPHTETERFIDTVLRPKTPYSLPLLRRCQYHQRNRTEFPHAELWLAFYQITQARPALIYENVISSISQDPTAQYLAAHIDVTVPGQTQIWLYASWEPDYAADFLSPKSVTSSPNFPLYQSLFTTLFNHLRTHHIPLLSATPTPQWQWLHDQGKLVSIPYSRSKILFGTVAECLWPLLEPPPSTQDPAPQYVTRSDRGYLKYVISQPITSESAAVSIPREMHIAPMHDRDLQTILDRSSIPRTIETLRQLVTLGLYKTDSGKPVAWGMLGKDASLSSLHTEPEYRGQGFAEVVARSLMQMQQTLYPDIEDGLTHTIADVSEDNRPSRRVMEKLGGVVMWKVAWLEVELGKGGH